MGSRKKLGNTSTNAIPSSHHLVDGDDTVLRTLVDGYRDNISDVISEEESDNVVFITFADVQSFFADIETAGYNVKKEALLALWLYVDDHTSTENDQKIDDIKTEIRHILNPVAQRLSEGDVLDVFPKIFALVETTL